MMGVKNDTLLRCVTVLFSGNSMFMDATAFDPGMKAILISPFIPAFLTNKCLSFRFYVYGYDSGILRILDETFEIYSSLRESSYEIFCIAYLPCTRYA